VTPEELELLSELTIITPTCNRPLELERAIEYWRDLPVTVHIIDGAIKPSFSLGQLVYRPAKIYYHSVPPELNEKPMENYARRLVKGMTLIQTKFGAQLADDDFFTTSGLCRALAILKTNEKIDAVIGKCATYNVDQQNVVWEKKYLNWVHDDLLQDDLLSIRINNDPGKYLVYYGVLRSEILRAIHSRANSFVFSDFRKNELIAHHLGLAYCRTMLIEEYLWVRQKALMKNPNYNYLIRPTEVSENRRLIDIFFEAFSEIDPSGSDDLKLKWASQKVKLIENRLKADDKKYMIITELTKIAVFETAVKRFLMKLILSSPKYVLLVVLKVAPSRFKKAIGDASPPDFEDKHYLENLLTKPREELRLRANI